ncbi:hypothetical protein [Aromatoleum anaerobium]|uniref:Uncharacterized protein n=1 Tax=Aromatoleum anaerobium TaxID=182180 RepID=A0ABX1PGT1_9RHOO|nr:hypothetical protein [Aromatoleum anaerobium]MCK0507675.1 hypothetical protein [Aromatoleum anaerobium]
MRPITTSVLATLPLNIELEDLIMRTIASGLIAAAIGAGILAAAPAGAASTSLHGWLWFAAVLPGTWLGGRLRPYFGL